MQSISSGIDWGLQDKVSVVTGAGSGIGLATARMLLDVGSKVMLVDRDESALKRAMSELPANARADYVVADVTVADDVARALDRAYAAFGSIAVMCNNAGIALYGSVLETSPDAWDRVMAVNLKSVFLGCKYAVPLMMESGGGTIVNTASDVGFRGAKRRAAYCASKAAVINLTRQVALDVADHNIRVNAVAPAAADTPFLEPVESDLNEVSLAKERMARVIPMARLARPTEIAQAIVWLASDLSSFTTGETLVIDGGALAGK